MIWIDNINSLWYYRKTAKDACYCEHLVYPNDLILQGGLFTNISSGFTVQVLVYSIDGLTQYEDATSYFSFYVGVSPNGKKFFNLRAEAFSPQMCAHACYILRVIVTANGKTLFDKFTEHYCQTTCCDIPNGIGIGTSSVDCPVYLNYIQRIFHYDVATDTLTQLATGSVEYTDIAVIGNTLYARGQYGDIDVYAINGLSLTFSNTITGLPTGAALGSDLQYLYIDDGVNIKKFLPSAPTILTTVVNGSYTAQGDIFIKSNGNILITVNTPTSVIEEWANGVLVDTYTLQDGSMTPINNVYGMFMHNGTFYILQYGGIIYSYDFGTESATQVSTAPQTLFNNTRWNGAAQGYSCGEIQPNTPDIDPIPISNCDQSIIQIKSRFECIDNETGLFYGIPDTVLTGIATFSYEKVFNLSGNIKRVPREINRTISYNCKLQRVESFKPYQVRGQGMDGLLPDWKLDELENMLSASYIEVNDFGLNFGKQSYQFDGGIVAEQVHECVNSFRPNFILRSCIVRTDFGCNDCTDISTKSQSFLISKEATGDNFFNENKQPIGDFDDLISYYEGLGYSVVDVSDSYSDLFGAIQVTGDNTPPPFYYDYTFQRFLVYPTDTPVSPAPVQCQPFELAYSYGATAACADFEMNYAFGEIVSVSVANVNDYGDWDTSGTTELTSTTGKLSLTTTNPTYTTAVTFAGEAIGIIDVQGRPALPQFIDLGSGRQIGISQSGIVSFYGDPDSVDGSGADITLTDVYYSLT